MDRRNRNRISKPTLVKLLCIVALSACILGTSNAANAKPSNAKPVIPMSLVREWPSDKVEDCLEQKAAENSISHQTWERFKQYKSDAEVAELRGEYSKARETWKQAALALQNTELFERAVSSLADLYIKHGNFDEGISAINSLTQANPKTPEGAACALAIGHIREGKNDYAGMMAAYTEAIDRSPESNVALFAVAAIKDAFESSGRGDIDISKLSDIANKYQNTALGTEALICTGELHWALGQENTAVSTLLSVGEKFPGSIAASKAKAKLGELYQGEASRLDTIHDVEGMLAARKLAFQYSGLAEDLCTLIDSLLDEKKFDEVHSYVQKGLASDDPGFGLRRTRLVYADAQAYQKADDVDTAIKLLNKLISEITNPQSIDILKNIVKYWDSEK